MVRHKILLQNWNILFKLGMMAANVSIQGQHVKVKSWFWQGYSNHCFDFPTPRHYKFESLLCSRMKSLGEFHAAVTQTSRCWLVIWIMFMLCFHAFCFQKAFIWHQNNVIRERKRQVKQTNYYPPRVHVKNALVYVMSIRSVCVIRLCFSNGQFHENKLYRTREKLAHGCFRWFRSIFLNR